MNLGIKHLPDGAAWSIWICHVVARNDTQNLCGSSVLLHLCLQKLLSSLRRSSLFSITAKFDSSVHQESKMSSFQFIFCSSSFSIFCMSGMASEKTTSVETVSRYIEVWLVSTTNRTGKEIFKGKRKVSLLCLLHSISSFGFSWRAGTLFLSYITNI